MSDDEDLLYIKKQKTIHYGSLEEQEKERLNALVSTVAAAAAGEENAVEDADKLGKNELGNLHVSDGKRMFRKNKVIIFLIKDIRSSFE